MLVIGTDNYRGCALCRDNIWHAAQQLTVAWGRKQGRKSKQSGVAEWIARSVI